jgi:ankyrin repeat protein
MTDGTAAADAAPAIVQTPAGAALVELVKSKDHEGLRAALAGGVDVHIRDDDDWCALDWAAGSGDETAIRLLLEHGADPCATGLELRTPYQIALSAGHLAAARLLRAAEEAADPSSVDRHVWRPYCKAYLLGAVRRYPAWEQVAVPGTADQLADDTVVFVHDDLTVTRGMWPGEDELIREVTADWTRFCHDELGFRVPDDFDLVPEGPQTST